MNTDVSQFVEWFRSASPYIHVHRNGTVVIKFDDDAVHSDTFNNLIHDLALLNSLGVQLVLVFGTRLSIEKLLKENNINLEYHKGLRITTQEAMEYVKQAAGKLRIEIESRLSMGLGNTPMSNAEMRVCSGNYVTAKPRGVVDGINYQFTGEIRNIDIASIRGKLSSNEIVLVPPVGYSTTGEAFNLNADHLAGKLAGLLKANKLIYMMEGEGLTDKGKLIHQLTEEQATEVLYKTDESSGIYPYLSSAIRACEAGVKRVHLIDRRIDGAMLLELFTRDGCGTMISSSPYDVVRKADIEDIHGILELLQPLEQRGVLVERSREKLELEISYFTLMERDGVIVACAALFPFADNGTAELACLAVHQDYSNNGYGEHLLSLLEKEAGELKLTSLFVLTTQTEHWFLEKGFRKASLDELPEDRQALYNFQRNSIVLFKDI